MIIEYIRYKITQEERDAFESAYIEAAKSLRASPQCLSYELACGSEEPENYILRIEWTSLDGHMEGFRKGDQFPVFLASVRPYIRCIEEMKHYEVTTVRSRPTIYEAVGGVATFFSLASQLHEEMKADPLLGPLFARAAESHVPHLAMWLCEVFGGPALYTETLGDITPILARHANLDISEQQRLAFVACAGRAISVVIPPSEESARAAIQSYIEWGTRVAVENAKPGHVPDPTAGVPRWDWPE